MTNATQADGAAQAGADLARYIRAVGNGEGDPRQYAQFVDRLVNAPCTTSTDALALLAWAVVTLPMVHDAMPEGDPEADFAKALLAQSFALVHGAAAGLVRETGIPLEAFTSSTQTSN